jgi:hypothetical protein
MDAPTRVLSFDEWVPHHDLENNSECNSCRKHDELNSFCKGCEVYDKLLAEYDSIFIKELELRSKLIREGVGK